MSLSTTSPAKTVQKYDISNLSLTDAYLTDPLLMALAWKRAHNYIRTTNWYADNFELDKSSLFLADKSKSWTAEIKSGLSLAPLQLVPAPKTCEWVFEPSGAEQCLDWQPKNADSLSLRPLAHIGIKEQTFFTLLLMCLANKVETEQGDPATDFKDVHEKGIVNYGNRLYCTYSDEGQAEHNYGATTIYSKFFIDYRKFLQRPYYFAQQHSTEKLPEEEIYIVELDLKQFYDQVDREVLVKKINSLISDKNKLKKKSQDAVQNLLNRFENWEWEEGTDTAYKVCSNGSESMLPAGIPQGLVAGGFLSNIYLLDFDKAMQEKFGQDISKPAQQWMQENAPNLQGLDYECFKLIDYCRYVDDMRLVVAGPKPSATLPLDLLKDILHHYIEKMFESVGLKIPLNQDKTKITLYRGRQQGLSKQLNDIQLKASGPQSYEESFEQLNQLEMLLALSSADTHEQDGDNCKINRLANIERNGFDVREDTLRRFAANKIASTLSDIRHFTARETDSSGNAIAGDWDYLQERLARRLIACWSKDPSLTLLLKKALELFPDPRLLEPVLEQFAYIANKKVSGTSKESKLRKLEIQKQQAIMDYLLAEVFRHSATVIHRKDPQAIPAHANVNAYFAILQNKAAELATSKTKDMLARQARFLLLVRLDTLLEKSTTDHQQDVIFKLATGFRNISTKLDKQQLAVCLLIAYQLVEDTSPFLRAANELLEQKAGPDVLLSEADSIIEAIAVQNPELVEHLIAYAKQLKYTWVKSDEVRAIIDALYIDIAPSKKPLAKITNKQSIIQLITRPDNPFASEIMAIKLMQALLDAWGSKEPLSGRLIDLSCTCVIFEGYSSPPTYADFDKELTIKDGIALQDAITMQLETLTQHNGTVVHEEQQALRLIAFAVRSALASSKDMTGFGHSHTPKAGYRGLKSTQFKRQIGLFTTPESLAGEGAQTTGWLTTLITKLLKWPGIRVNEQGYSWPIEFDFTNVERLLKERLASLKKSYCQLSGMPTLSELIKPDWPVDKKSLTVAMVQTKLPKTSDLATDIYLNATQYRTKHRRHIARAAELVLKHITAQSTEKAELGKSEQHIDLIVFPELAVHPDDLNILIQLSRKTHAIIFAGLGFMDQPNISGPNNNAIWIVPRKHNGNGNEICRFQGKQHMTAGELKLEIKPWRPYQLMLELRHPAYKEQKGFMLTGAICYDATDIKLSADLADKSNALLISALNKDVNTFNSMVDALHFHMYQHIVLVNTGEYGGSYAMAPYQERHERLIAHTTGKNQVTINTFEMNMFDFRKDGVGRGMVSNVKVKAPPAGVIQNKL